MMYPLTKKQLDSIILEKTIPEVFRDAVSLYAEKDLFICRNMKISYAEFDVYSDNFAYTFVERGIKSGDTIAVISDRSIETVAAMYGVLKAGAAYVYIDPSLPKKRISYMLNQSNAVMAVIENDNLEIAEICESNNCHTIAINSIHREKIVDFDPPYISNDSTATIMFTSGTTGFPKGAVLTHRNILASSINSFNMIKGNGSVIVSVSTFSFVASLFDLFLGMFGYTSILTTEEERTNPEKFNCLVTKYNADTILTSPSRIGVLISGDVNSAFQNFKVLMLAGERLAEKLVERIRGITNADIINCYGTTEATGSATAHCCFRNEVGDPPIGKPVSGVRATVLNKDNKSCKTGEAGELYIGGPSVSIGYIGAAELTTQKFVYLSEFGEVFYRTGDKVRTNDQGELEILGRIDRQFNINGVRIEPDEIKNTIINNGGVAAAEVVKKTGNGIESIFAFIVPNTEITSSDIDLNLRKQLPDSYIPSEYMFLEKMPLNINGKIDLGVLEQLASSERRKEYFAPETSSQKLICEGFETILKCEGVGIDDDFFALGGNSLLTIMLCNYLEKKCGSRPTVKDVFRARTVRNIDSLVFSNDRSESIKRAEEKKYYPMPSAQKRIYTIQQYDYDCIAYNTPFFFKLSDNIDANKMQCAYRKLIEINENLRTALFDHEGEAVQMILDTVDPDFSVVTDFDKSFEDLSSDFVRPFDLKNGNTSRMQINWCKDGVYLFVDFHHSICDGTSVGIMMEQLSDIYEGKTVEPDCIRFRDFSEWYNAIDWQKQLLFWENTLDSEISPIELPYDKKRPEIQSFNGDLFVSSIDTQLAGNIKKIAEQYNATEYMVLLAALMIILSRYGNREDVVIGCPVSGRNISQIENVTGMFVNTLPIRGYPEKDKPFNDFIEEIKSACFGAFENQDCPLELIVERLGVKRDTSRNPLFDVILVLQNNIENKLSIAGESFKGSKIRTHSSMFDIAIEIVPDGSEYRVHCEYCSDLFEQSTIKRFIECYISSLREVTENSLCKIKKYNCTTEGERNQILVNFNDTECEYPREKTIAEIFEEQVRTNPESIAVVFGDESLTYRELNGRANTVGMKLRNTGVGADDFVAVISERSIEMIVGIFGILKAGGAYVPIDPEYPEERIKYMLDDCKPKAVLVCGAELDDALCQIPVINLKEEEYKNSIPKNPEIINDASSLAYLIYTSGTTGKPKGVMVEQRNVINYCAENSFNVFGNAISQQATVISVTTVSFDIFVTEAILTMLNGLKVVIAAGDALNFGDIAAEIIAENGIDTIQTTPSRIKSYMESRLFRENVSRLKSVLLGGESVPKNICDMLIDYGAEKVYNVYGPAETTVWSAQLKVEKSRIKNTVGTPISNTQIYILQGNTLCGIGMPGELCIAGAGVSRGYLNRP
ncbi:MAG: AMP-binding protein, partial [Oscillospiraceae bacterium]|nr:AMP-binding protein [Oscillospiraceae bacterium]